MSYICESTPQLIKGINNETSKKLVEYKQYIALNDNEIFLTDELPPNFITITPQFMLEKLKVIEKVKKRIYELNDGWKPDWNDDGNPKYFFEYDYYDDTIEINSRYIIKPFDNTLYLKSYELAEQLINELEKELKIMLEMELFAI